MSSVISVSPVDLLQRVRNAQYGDVLLWQAAGGLAEGVDLLASSLASSRVPIVVLVRAGLCTSTVNGILSIARAAPLGVLSLTSYRTLGEDLCDIAAGRLYPLPTMAIIRRLLRSWPPDINEILIAAAVVGRARVAVAELAAVCKLRVRTLEWHLQRAGIIDARRLLSWMLALHVVWGLDVMRRPTKQVAVAAGLSSAGSLAQFLRRRAGFGPKSLQHFGGFDSLLDRCSECLGVNRPASSGNSVT